MISEKVQHIDLSAATQREFRERITVAASGATMVLQGAEPVYAAPTDMARRVGHYLGSIVYSVMLPLVAVDDYVFRSRKYDAATANAYVYYIGEWVPDLLEFPSVEAVWPHRQTLRFRSDRPARRLPKRQPFVPTSAPVIEIE